jgi:hypothetical protein
MSIELNAMNFKTVANGVMKEKDMHVRKSFTPVESSYKVVAKNSRFSIDLSETVLKIAKEVKKHNVWKFAKEKVYSGTREQLEDIVIDTIKRINKKI